MSVIIKMAVISIDLQPQTMPGEEHTLPWSTGYNLQSIGSYCRPCTPRRIKARTSVLCQKSLADYSLAMAMEGMDMKPIPMSEQPLIRTSETRYMNPWLTGKLVEDVAIKFLNRTGRIDFAVVVFVKNENPNAALTKFVAWHVIHTQSAASFIYPMETQVGALYEDDGVRMRAGPHITRLGATWEFYQEIPMATPFMREGKLKLLAILTVCHCRIACV